ncbi:spore germination protein GerPC [Ammoniphilus sp. YIM 78166]|uniref:spore germination protein GerPC n=1 Tax=Ammoniphilus sp. YIM 78166 TaxID=1644106 RepID=UPI00107032EA|nr:spore germination protein GerPC [Ammoniphilus sp. YIM 78166]
MYMHPYYYQYIHHMNMTLQAQQKALQDIQKMVAELNQEVNELKNRPTNVNNTYQFDLLKVERLEGTLSIGLNPNGEGNSLGDLSINQSISSPKSGTPHSELFGRICTNINNYLDTDAYETMKSLEAQYQRPLEDAYRKFIIQDVKRQIDQRIMYYLHQLEENGLDENQQSDMEHMIYEKVQQDISKTFQLYLQNLPQKGDIK